MDIFRYEIRKETHSRTYGKKSNKAIMRSSLESGLVSVMITQPLWIIKTRLQLNLESTHTVANNFILTIDTPPPPPPPTPPFTGPPPLPPPPH